MKLVLNQVMGGDDVSTDPVERRLGAPLPGLFKGHSVNVLQDVNAGWRLADLKDGVWIVAEIGGTQAGDWRALGSQSAKAGFAIFDFGADEKIEILGRARLGVDANRVPPDDQVFNSVFVEHASELLQIFG
jgi:hypothetical protein